MHTLARLYDFFKLTQSCLQVPALYNSTLLGGLPPGQEIHITVYEVSVFNNMKVKGQRSEEVIIILPGGKTINIVCS